MQRNSQFMERLFTLMMTGAYGIVMVWLYLSHNYGRYPGERSLLSLVTTWIQYVILLGGVFLLILFVILLWNFKKHTHVHHHVHEHDDHDHEACDHDHGHEHHNHDHAEHECCDHDHGWNPIRYIPLLIPLILIVMGLPDTAMIENFEKHRIDAAIKLQKRPVSNEQMSWMMVNVFTSPAEVFVPISFTTAIVSGLQSMIDELDGEARNEAPVLVDLAQLEKVLKDPGLQQQYAAYGRVEIEGMFNLEEVGPVTIFRLVRLRMACCLTDSRPSMLLCVTRKKLPDQLVEKSTGPGTKWVKVQGRLKFAQTPEGTFQALLKASSVEPKPVPPFPYLN